MVGTTPRRALAEPLFSAKRNWKRRYKGYVRGWRCCLSPAWGKFSTRTTKKQCPVPPAASPGQPIGASGEPRSLSACPPLRLCTQTPAAAGLYMEPRTRCHRLCIRPYDLIVGFQSLHLLPSLWKSSSTRCGEGTLRM